VCCRLRLHAVSPCRIAKTFTFASSRLKRCQPLWTAPRKMPPPPAPIASR
jgi:hypothetical protein